MKSTVEIKSIKRGKRIRQDCGDITSLAASIADVGLLQPVVVTEDLRLIAGLRRIEACESLGHDAIRAVVVRDMEDAVRRLHAERDENTCRKDFSPSEKVALGTKLEALERPKAAARKAQAPGQPRGRKVSGGKKPRETKTRDIVGAAVGMSGSSYEKACAVVEAGEQVPELRQVVVEMDATGNVTQAFRKVNEHKRQKKRDQNRAQVAKASDPAELIGAQLFSTIVIDPPWDFADEGDFDPLGRGRPDYATMPIEQIAALPLADLAAPDAHLYLWITNRSLPKGFALLDAWGFRHVSMLTWCKPSFGMGNYFRGSTEHVLFGVRGSLALKRKDVGTWFQADRPERKHSAKPPFFLELVESCSPGPYLEMFSRSKREGWTAWGEASCH